MNSPGSEAGVIQNPAAPADGAPAASGLPPGAWRSARTTALLSVILLMVVWGSTFVVTKATVREWPPLTLAAVRFLMAAVVLAPFALARGGLGVLPRPLPIARLALMGLLGVVIFSVGFNYALVHASATQGALIYALTPAAIAAAAVLGLAEVPSRRRSAGIVLSVAGVVGVVAAGESSAASPAPLLGAACMAAAVLAWAGYTVLAKRLAANDQIVVIACVSALGALMLAPLAALELWQAPWPNPSAQGWLGLVFLSVVASALAFIVYGRALRVLDASLVGAYANLDPIVGVLTAVLLLGESLNGLQVAGGVVALAGLWLASS